MLDDECGSPEKLLSIFQGSLLFVIEVSEMLWPRYEQHKLLLAGFNVYYFAEYLVALQRTW